MMAIFRMRWIRSGRGWASHLDIVSFLGFISKAEALILMVGHSIRKRESERTLVKLMAVSFAIGGPLSGAPATVNLNI